MLTCCPTTTSRARCYDDPIGFNREVVAGDLHLEILVFLEPDGILYLQLDVYQWHHVPSSKWKLYTNLKCHCMMVQKPSKNYQETE